VSHLRQAWAAAAAPQSGSRWHHLWLPADPVVAHSALVHLSRTASRRTAAGSFDHDRLADLVSEGGGFSHHPTQGTPPASGFMASYHADEGSPEAAVHHISQITPDHIAEHRAAIGHHLEQPDSYQGGWHDKATGDVYLDASRHFHDEPSVRKFSVQQHQKAYFDLHDFSTKYVHPKLDPDAMKDHDAWKQKYAEVGHEPPAGYSSYQHKYPASDEQKSHWAEQGHHLAQAPAEPGVPMGPWLTPGYADKELARRAGKL
jgi:hypothetical protein